LRLGGLPVQEVRRGIRHVHHRVRNRSRRRQGLRCLLHRLMAASPTDFETLINAKSGVRLPGVLGAPALAPNSSGNIIAGSISGPAIPRGRAYKTTAQAIPTGTWTPVQLDAEQFDTDTIHDTATNNSRLTCKTAGIYLCVGNVYLVAAVGGTQRMAAWIR